MGDPQEDSHRTPATDPDVPTLDLSGDRRSPGPKLREGETVDRYTVLRRLGAGGMGEVYLAYDPKLDRQVALKLLLGDGDESTQIRLQREAVALARLTHPNVVAVHDVGQYAGSTFITMEYVKGQTLHEWLQAGERSWRETLAIVMAAGRGLGAAHDAGLVHRDFKPGNVIVGEDGRARVLDFGLARGSGIVEAVAASLGFDSVSDARPEAVPSDVTRAGQVLGTPGYMAPEQIAGAFVDSRSDQFAFCVVLYRALFGQRPFAGDNVGEVEEAIVAGRIRPVPAASSVPAAVRKAIHRGLSAAPTDRFASMAALLNALDRGSKSARRRTLGAVVGGVLATAAALWFNAASRSPCSSAGDDISATWNEQRRAAVRQAFNGTGKGYAAATLERALPLIDDYVAQWLRARVQACRATHVQHTQSELLLDQRIACLDERRHTLEALLSLFEDIEAGGLRDSVEALANLPAIDDCTAANLASRQLDPVPPELADRVAGVRHTLARVRALLLAARSQDAYRVALSAREEAEAVGYDPLTARVLLQLGGAFHQTGGPPQEGRELFEQAIALADRSGDQATAVAAMAGLARYYDERLGQSEFGLWLAEHAQARSLRVRIPAEPRNTLDLTRGTLLMRNGRTEEAIELFTRQSEQPVDSPADRVYRLSALQNLGVIYGRAADYEASDRIIRRALEEGERLFGSDNPRLAAMHSNMANNAYHTGRHEEAIERAELAIELWKQDGGENTPALANSQQVLAANYQRLGRFEQAHAHSLQAYELQRKTLEEEHPSIGSTLTNMASALTGMGRHQEALDTIDRALAIFDKSEGADSLRLPVAWDTRGTALLALGRYDEALAEFDKALEHIERVRHSDYVVARIQWGHGVALWETNPTSKARARAVEQARRARELLAGQPGDPAREIEEIENWLRSHPMPAGDIDKP